MDIQSREEIRVTFETKCYENDWEILLKTNRLRNMATRHTYPFTERILYINNVSNYSRVRRFADTAVDQGIIDKYMYVQDYASEALDFFGITKDDLGKGYYYSIQELVGIYLCKTEYLLHYSSDTLLIRGGDWVQDAISVMEARPEIVVANPVWSTRIDAISEVAEQSHGQDDLFYYGYGFSDQCYLIPVRVFRAPIYGECNPVSARYPLYGGELFEKRVDSWMRNHLVLRATRKTAAYKHKNFPHGRLKKAWEILTGKYNK